MGRQTLPLQAYTGRHSPSVSQWTDWRQGRRLHSLLLLPASIPPSIKHTSLTLHLHYDGCLSPARLIISSSFTSPGSSLFLHSSLASTVCFFMTQVHLPGPFSLQPFPYFIMWDLRWRETSNRLFVRKKKVKEEEEGVLVFEPDILPFHGV